MSLRLFAIALCYVVIGIAGCVPVESEPIAATDSDVISETAVLPNAAIITMIPTTAVFPQTTTPSPTTAPDATTTPTSLLAVLTIIPPTRIFMTPTPYPFERPAACFPPAERPENYPENYEQHWKACTDLLYSPNREWIAMLIGLDTCSTDIALYHHSSGDCAWPQDWIRVRRVPYMAEDFYQWLGSPLSSETNWECISRGVKCSYPSETIWLNWRTGEIGDEETSPLLPAPTPTLPGW